MKVDRIKLLISFAISALLGYLCYIATPEMDNRNWVALFTTTLSLFVSLAPALAFKFESIGNRTVSGKLVGWIFFIILVIVNFLLSHSGCKTSTYIAITALIAIIGVAIIYSICKS